MTIYSSYVAAQKHLDRLGDSDAEALNLAQNGYSVKNLPFPSALCMMMDRTITDYILLHYYIKL